MCCYSEICKESLRCSTANKQKVILQLLVLKGFLTGLGPISKPSHEAAVSITPTCLRQKSFMMATGVWHPEYEIVYTQWVTVLPDRIEQAGFVRSLGGYRS